MKQRGNILFLVLALTFILISLSKFSQAGTLKVTEEHPFLINGSWIPASDLKVGDELTTIDGKKVRITSIQDIETKEPFPVYNLEAGKYSNFIVDGGDGLGVVVHNSNLRLILNIADDESAVVYYFFKDKQIVLPDGSTTSLKSLIQEQGIKGSRIENLGALSPLQQDSVFVSILPKERYTKTLLSTYGIRTSGGPPDSWVAFKVSASDLRIPWQSTFGAEYGARYIPLSPLGIPRGPTGYRYLELTKNNLVEYGKVSDLPNSLVTSRRDLLVSISGRVITTAPISISLMYVVNKGVKSLTLKNDSVNSLEFVSSGNIVP